jgi:hypothetical protein
VREFDANGAGRIRQLGELFSMFLLYDYLRAHGIVVQTPVELAALDGHGRTLVSNWISGAAGWLVEAISQIALIADPEAVLIGGRMPVRLIDELIVEAQKHFVQAGLPSVPIHRAVCSEDAAALGAAAMPLAHRLGLPSADAGQLKRVPLRMDHDPASISAS